MGFYSGFFYFIWKTWNCIASNFFLLNFSANLSISRNFVSKNSSKRFKYPENVGHLCCRTPNDLALQQKLKTLKIKVKMAKTTELKHDKNNRRSSKTELNNQTLKDTEND